MKKNISTFMPLAGALVLFLLSSCSTANEDATSGTYPIEPVPFTEVHLEDDFWAPRIKINHEVTIPIAIEQSEESGRIKNFEIAGGTAEGSFCSVYPFDDSDVYKIIEAASYSLQMFPDAKLEAKLDSLIHLIAEAQEEDGYLYTNLTIAQMNHEEPHPWVGEGRWDLVHDLSHELYNLGHLFEAAVAHYQATGKESLLQVAVKAADMLDENFGWGKIENYPGHQVVELGLVKLSLLTGEERYKDLAKFFLDVRGPDGPEYCQAHKKVVDQEEAVGHAVRATYMYEAMADVAALYDDESYIHAIRKIWEDMVYRKTYVTGGIGASGGNEGFAVPYELPNMSAYCETCASVGNINWNYRMFLYDGDAKYLNVLERTLYNALLSGVSLSGDRFFYPNVLESMGQHTRSKWFGCACCPPNIARLLPSLPGMFYAHKGNELYVNLFASNTAEIAMPTGNLTISQETNFPWDGEVKIVLNPEQEQRFNLKIRIPGWAENTAIPGDLYTFSEELDEEIKISVNGEDYNYKIEKGYAIIKGKWKTGDEVLLELPMEVRELLADEKVKADSAKIAYQRGPIVYTCEWPEVEDGNVMNLIFSEDAEAELEERKDLLNGVYTLKVRGQVLTEKQDGSKERSSEQNIELIPYYAWANRGPGQMKVWLPISEESAVPMLPPTFSSRSEVSASTPTRSLGAVHDLMLPSNSNDHTFPYYHWWPKNNSLEWLEYQSETKEEISSIRVYWFDDRPFGGCRIPESWKVYYKVGNQWKEPAGVTEYPVVMDGWSRISFDPVVTDAVKLEVKLPEKFSAGIHEWIVE